MKNLRNIFKSYQDPKIYRDLKIGFACLIVLGVLVAFVVSPPLRHAIGIGDNHPVTTPKEYVNPHHHHAQHPGHQQGKTDHVHKGQQSHAQGNPDPGSHHHTSNSVGGLEGITEPPSSGGNPGGSPANPPSSSPPASHPPTHTEPSGGNNNNPGDSGSGVTDNPGHVGVEAEVPGIAAPPLIEEVTHGVNETVNGLTSTVNEVTEELPVQVEVPEVCVLKC